MNLKSHSRESIIYAKGQRSYQEKRLLIVGIVTQVLGEPFWLQGRFRNFLQYQAHLLHDDDDDHENGDYHDNDNKTLSPLKSTSLL